jgi:putative hydrolase of the HAD superfamily
VTPSSLPDDVCAVAFDAVGTLLFPQPPAAVVYAEAGGQFGSCLTEAEIAARFLTAFQGEEIIDRAQGFRTSEERELLRWQHIVGEVLDDVRDPEACFQALFDHFSRPQAWRCNPEAASTLQALGESGYDLSIASNYDHRLRSVVRGKPELDRIGRLVISSEVGWRKPAPEFFAAIATAHGLAASQILYVGDDLVNDCEAAQAAGMRAVLYSPEENGTTPQIRRLTELLRMDRRG